MVNAIDKGLRRDTIAVHSEDNELITAYPAYDVRFPEDFSQDISSLHKRGISFHVAELVVDLFHVVQVCVYEQQASPGCDVLF